MIGVLQAADELPLETVQQFYLELANTPENRLYSFEVLPRNLQILLLKFVLFKRLPVIQCKNLMMKWFCDQC